MDMQKTLKSFKGKRVFITGHTGFKGSWLAFILQEIGAKVMGFALPPQTEPNHFNLLDLKNKISHVVGDIRDGGAMEKAMLNFKPEYVFHLAAQALVRQSYDDPVATITTNVVGSANLLEAVRKCDDVRSLVYITSDKCYENEEWTWGYRENDQLGGRDPYSASKAAAEIIFSSYARSFFQRRPELGAATARAGNVIGGGDWAVDRIIPDCIRAIKSDQPIYLRNPCATRPWQHVLEPIGGYLQLAACLYQSPKDYAGSWNFGPSTQEIRTVQNVAEVVVSHLGRGKVILNKSHEQPHEANLLQLNCDKAHNYLGWYPRWDVNTTLKATALWYKKMLATGQAQKITLEQVQQYFPELS
jgi:CDP-glucose 4,6-dehydratase